jgi:hypothetical protein
MKKRFVTHTFLIDDPQESRERYANAKVDVVLISDRRAGWDRREGSAMRVMLPFSMLNRPPAHAWVARSNLR